MITAATALHVLPRTRRHSALTALLASVALVAVVGAAQPVHAAVPAVTTAADLVAQVMLAPAGLQSEANRPAPEDIPAAPVLPERPAQQSDRADRGQDVEVADEAADEVADAGWARPFARVGDTELVLPGDVRTIGFHQGSKAGLELRPTGEMEKDLNLYRDAPASTRETAVPYYVLGTRNRGVGAATAVDLSIEHGKPLVSPVTGTVKTVQSYSLYGRTPDVIIEIVPEAEPERLVRIMHVEGVKVDVGDDVEAGETPMAASGRQLPFPSQIDRLAGRHPHVHLEVVEP